MADSKSSSDQRQKNTQSIVLEEKFDEAYEPTAEELSEYAVFLGLDLEAEPHLVWIARAGLKAPLPKQWKPCQTNEGQVYYFNFKTGESVWNHPCDDRFLSMYQEARKKNPIPPRGWQPGNKADKEKELLAIQPEEEEEEQLPEEEIIEENEDELEDDHEDVQVIPQVVVQEAGRSSRQLPDNRSSENLQQPNNNTSRKGLRFDDNVLHVDPIKSNSSRRHPSLNNLASAAEDDRVKSTARATISVRDISAGTSLAPFAKSMGNIGPMKSSLATRKTSSANQRPSQFDFSVFQLDESLLADESPSYSSSVTKQPSSSAVNTKQNEVATKLMQEKIEGMRRNMEDREREERMSHDTQISAMRASYAAQRDEFEQTERSRLDKYYSTRSHELEQITRERIRSEEKCAADDLERIRSQLKEDCDLKQRREESRLHREMDDTLERFKRDMDAKYAQALNEDVYRQAAEKKKVHYANQLDTELDRLRGDYELDKANVTKSHEEELRDLRRRHESLIADLQEQYKRRKEDTESSGEIELENVKLKWRQRYDTVKVEAEQKEKKTLAQKSDTYKAQLRDKLSDLQKEHELAVVEWQTKITKTKAQLSQELQSLESKLANARDQNSQEHEHTIVSSFVSTRNQVNSAIKENDELFTLQRRRREFLEKEAKVLDEMETRLKQKSQRLNIESQAVQGGSMETYSRPPSQMQHRSPSRSSKKRVSISVQAPIENPEFVEYDNEITPRPRVSRSVSRNSQPIDSRRETNEEVSQSSLIPQSISGFVWDKETFQDDLDYSSGDDDEETDDALQTSTLPPEIARPLESETQEINKTKKKLKSQRGKILERHQELEDTRQRWKKELEEMSVRLTTSANVTHAEQSYDDSVEFGRDYYPAVTEDEYARREPLGPAQTHFTYDVHDKLARSSAPRNSVPRTVTTRYFPVEVPTHTHTSAINQWTSDQHRNEEVLRNHGLWLHKFRKRVGQQRGVYIANNNTKRYEV